MPSWVRVLVRAAVVLVAAATTWAVIASPQAYAVTSHRALNDTRAVGPAPVSVGFPIEYFGLVADLPTTHSHLSGRGHAPYGEARFMVHGTWTAWQVLDQDGAQQPGQFTGALVPVDRADAYQVRGLPAGAGHWRAAAINTTDGPSVVVGETRADAAVAAGGNCMSRADWGADESISGWAHGDVQTYYPAQALTVHHTAGSNDPNQDFAATVRAIYSYHVQTNGWSDIGYQYLVDATGKVYEGRNSGHTSLSCLTQGGTGADFAHQSSTDDVVTGAHVAGFNSGNIGIALMGCYEPTSACSGDTTPPAAAVDGLETLLASLATRHGLDPAGTVHYVNPVSGATVDQPTISGHRDWEATACPGGRLYADLPAIRTEVAARMSGTSATVPGAPTGFTATASGSSVALAWSAPTSNGGSSVTSYEVYRGTSQPVPVSGTPVYRGPALTATDQPAAGTYYYAARACNAVGCGATATAGPATVAPPPPAAITSASCSGAKCTFKGTGTGTLHWAFGNGGTGTGASVSVTYKSAGTYAVTLTDSQSPPTSASRPVTCSLVKKAVRCTT